MLTIRSILAVTVIVILLVGAGALHYQPSIVSQSISGGKDETIDFVYTFSDGRRVIVGRFNSVTIDVGNGTTLSNSDTTGTTHDVYVVMYDTSNNVLWAKSFGGTGEETVHFAGYDQTSATASSSYDTNANNLIKLNNWNGIIIYGLTNSVNFYVPTEPVTTRSNHDSSGQTNDIYAVKLNITNGDPWMSMLIGGSGNEGIHDYPGQIVGTDTYIVAWTQSATYDWGGAEEVAGASNGQTRYYSTKLNTKDYWIIRWRGYSVYSTTKSTTRHFAVPGTDPVIYREHGYLTQALRYWTALGPKVFATELKSQNYVYGFELSTSSQYISSQKTISNSDTSGNTRDVLLARQLSNGAWSTGAVLQGTSNEYVTQVVASQGTNFVNIAIGTFMSPSLTFRTEVSPASPAGTTSLSTTLANSQSGTHDVWIVNFSPLSTAGDFPRWALSIGGTGNDFADRIVPSANLATVFVQGRFQSSAITMNSQSYSKSAGSDATSEDIFFASLAATSGTYNFATVIGGAKTEKVVNITEAADGVYVCGHYDSQTLNVDSGTLTNAGDGTTYDIFIVKYNLVTGAVLWKKTIGGSSNDYLQAVVQPAGGGIVLFGLFEPSTFTIGEYTLRNDKASGYSAFLVFIQNDGTFGWVKQLDGSFSSDSTPLLARNSVGFSMAVQYSNNFNLTPYDTPIEFESTSGIDVFSASFTTLCNIGGVQCSGHGTCNSGTNLCTCQQNYVVSGTQCIPRQCYSIDYNSPSVCSGHGTCISGGTCSCTGGYSGTQCDEQLTCNNILHSDPSACSGHGTCAAQDQCSCDYGWNGNDCQQFTCFGTNSTDSNACSGHGACNDIDECSCSHGYAGDKCNIVYNCYGTAATNSKVCSGRGTCTGTNECTCSIGYAGFSCQRLCSQCFTNDYLK